MRSVDIVGWLEAELEMKNKDPSKVDTRNDVPDQPFPADDWQRPRQPWGTPRCNVIGIMAYANCTGLEVDWAIYKGRLAKKGTLGERKPREASSDR